MKININTNIPVTIKKTVRFFAATVTKKQLDDILNVEFYILDSFGLLPIIKWVHLSIIAADVFYHDDIYGN